MKVLLVRPPAPNALSFSRVLDNEPIELEYLHTALQRRGIEDAIFDGLLEYDIIAAIKREQPDVVALTGYITQQDVMLRFCEIAKQYNPPIITVVGGVHAQLNYRSFYQDSVDYVYRSESVDDFARLVSLLGTQKLESALSEINGLCYREAGIWQQNELRPIDINSLPIPDRSFFNQHKRHYRYLDLTEVATMKTALSCPYHCNFCYCTLLAGGHYRARDLNLVIEELAGIDAPAVQITDDDFLVDRDRLWRFIELIKARGICKIYVCYARADFIAQNPDIVNALAEIGFKYFLVGLEAATDKELSSMNKATSVNLNEQCIRVVRESGAHCVALMISPIDADREYFEHLYHWVLKNKLEYVTVSVFTPIPGTPLYEEYKDRITSSDIVDWDFLHLVLEPTKLTTKQFYYEYRKLFLRLYKIARKTGIYHFMDLRYYKNLLMHFLRRKIKGV